MNTSLDYLIMGLLISGDKSGYDIKKTIELSPVPSISSSSGAIYPAIRRLERDEILEKHLVMQENRPNKQVLSLTKKGQETFLKWLRKPIGQDEFFMTSDPFGEKFLFFANLSDEEVKLHCLSQIDLLTVVIENVKVFERKYSAHLDRYAKWNLKGTYLILEGRIQWLNEIISELTEGGR
jgi:DNA-binding PadR family transcriptional regulator